MREYKKVESNIWKPTTKGDVLEGVVKSINPNGAFGFQAVIVSDVDGKDYITPSQKALQARLQQGALKVGEAVKITFTGTVKAKKGNDTMLYDVEISEKA